jgi:hypothetical protein
MLNNYRQTMPVNDRPVYYKGEKLMDMKKISRDGLVGLRSQQNAEVVEEDQFRKMMAISINSSLDVFFLFVLLSY